MSVPKERLEGKACQPASAWWDRREGHAGAKVQAQAPTQSLQVRQEGCHSVHLPFHSGWRSITRAGSQPCLSEGRQPFFLLRCDERF